MNYDLTNTDAMTCFEAAVNHICRYGTYMHVTVHETYPCLIWLLFTRALHKKERHAYADCSSIMYSCRRVWCPVLPYLLAGPSMIESLQENTPIRLYSDSLQRLCIHVCIHNEVNNTYNVKPFSYVYFVYNYTGVLEILLYRPCHGHAIYLAYDIAILVLNLIESV